MVDPVTTKDPEDIVREPDSIAADPVISSDPDIVKDPVCIDSDPVLRIKPLPDTVIMILLVPTRVTK